MGPDDNETSEAATGTLHVARWSEVCPVCDYLLTGLPDAGICPECGEKYDTSAIILNGWFSERLARNSGAPRHTVAWILPVAMWGVALFFILRVPGIGFARVTMFAPAIYGLLPMIDLIGTRNTGRVQVRLNDWGAAQYNHLNPSYEWLLAGSYLRLGVALALLAIICLHQYTPMERYSVYFTGLFALCWTAGEICRGHLIRRRLAAFRRSGSADLKAFLKKPTKWGKLKLVEFTNRKGDLYKLRLDQTVWWRVQNWSIIIYFRCTEEQAGSLRSLLARSLATGFA